MVSYRTTPKAAISWPDSATHGKGKVLLQLTWPGAGLVGVSPEPALVVYTDGTVLKAVYAHSTNGTLADRNLGDPTYRISRLSRAGIATLVKRLTAAGFVGDSLPKAHVNPDGQSTSLTVRVGGREYRSTVGDGSPDTEFAFLDELQNLRALVGAGNIVNGPVMRSPQLAVWSYGPYSPHSKDATTSLPWPVATVSISSAVTSAGCRVVVGADADAVRAAVAASEVEWWQHGEWRVDESYYGVRATAELPGVEKWRPCAASGQITPKS